MAKTFLELQTALAYWLDESGAIGGLTGGSTSTEAKQWLNWAYREMLRVLYKETENVGWKEATITWVSGTETYDLPDDFQSLRDVEDGWEAGTEASERYRINVIDCDDRRRYYSSNIDAEGGSACYIMLDEDGDQKIGFVPIPTVNKTANIKLWYQPRATALSADGDEILPIIEDHWECIVVKAARLINQKAGLDPTFLMEREGVLMEQFVYDMRNIQRQTPQYQKQHAGLWEDAYGD